LFLKNKNAFFSHSHNDGIYIILFNKKKIKNFFNYFFIKNNFFAENLFLIKFKSSDLFKHAKFNINVNFLRKNKVFNKGRYSRNRQNYRTGVY
jgi:hypothetical protein